MRRKLHGPALQQVRTLRLCVWPVRISRSRTGPSGQHQGFVVLARQILKSLDAFHDKTQ